MHHDTDFDALQERCAKTSSFAELVAIAIEEIQKFPNGADFVCGPISTGGFGSLAVNMRIFAKTIQELQRLGIHIFSQMPYERQMSVFLNRWRSEDPSRAGEYFTPILTDFYQPLFDLKLIHRGWFIPGWETSVGATWERERLSRARINICDINRDWFNSYIETA